jgi:hypothetical protein
MSSIPHLNLRRSWHRVSVGVIGLLAVAAAWLCCQSNAEAFFLRPCPYTGPQIVPGSSAPAPPTVVGSCFTPGDIVDVWFWAGGIIRGDSAQVTSAGTFSVPALYTFTNSTETVEAFDFQAGVHSNTLTPFQPLVQ